MLLPQASSSLHSQKQQPARMHTARSYQGCFEKRSGWEVIDESGQGSKSSASDASRVEIADARYAG